MADDAYGELAMGADGQFIIPKKSKVISFRWQDGFVSPFLATSQTALSNLVAAIQTLHAERPTGSAPFDSVVDLGSGKGDILFALADASEPGGLLHGKLAGKFVGVELDGELVAESNAKAAAIGLSAGRSTEHELVFVKGDVVTHEIFLGPAEMESVFGCPKTTVESVCSAADIITVFLLPAAISKMIPFLRRMIEGGKIVISIKWSLEYSGQSLEEYRDSAASSDFDSTPPAVITQLNGKISDQSNTIAKLEAALEAQAFAVTSQKDQIEALKATLALADKRDQLASQNASSMTASLTRALQEKSAAHHEISRLQSLNPSAPALSDPTAPFSHPPAPFDRADSGISLPETDLVPSIRLLTNWLVENGFKADRQFSDQFAFASNDAINVPVVSCEEEGPLKNQIAQFLAPGSKVHALLAKAMHGLLANHSTLDILKHKSLGCVDKDVHQDVGFMQRMDILMDEFPLALSLKRAVFEEEEIKMDWRVYSWEDAAKRLRAVVQENVGLKQRKLKLEREIGDLEQHLRNFQSSKPVPGLDSDILAAMKQAKSHWREFAERKYDYFISYRVSSDAPLAKEMYFRLRLMASNDRVFLDSEKLKDGNDWTEGFSTGLKHSKIVVLIVSDGSLERMKHANESQDNVLLEWENAILAAAEAQCAVLPRDVISSLYSVQLPDKRFENPVKTMGQCFLSPHEIIRHLRSLQGVFLPDMRMLKQILPKFSEKLDDINKCWVEKLSRAVRAKDELGLGDISRVVSVKSVPNTELLNAFLESSLTYFDKWECLSLEDSKFKQLDVFIHLFGNTSVMKDITLELSGNELNNGALNSLFLNSKYSFISELVVTRNNLTNQDMSLVATALLKSSTIRVLNLSDNLINLEQGCRSLTMLLKGSQSLQELVLGGNKVLPKGVQAIADGLAHSKTLIKLDLYETGIQLGGAWAIMLSVADRKFEFKHQSFIRSGHSILPTMEDLKYSGVANITHVDVSWNLSPQDESIVAFMHSLQKMENLKFLNLSGCKIDIDLKNSGKIFSGTSFIFERLADFKALQWKTASIPTL
ncbi:hypothetical protein HDU98_002663 [Podochytrium sp. JEL0797]|nr:hypothetical protein HDU98_002663 [Podochytrium sp. JEL0797]